MRVAARSIICWSGILRPSCTHWRYSASVVLLNARTIFWMQTCLVWSRVVLEWVWAMTRNPDYIKENIEVYNFKLSEDDMKKIRGLDKEKRFFTSTLAEIQHFKDWNPGD